LFFKFNFKIILKLPLFVQIQWLTKVNECDPRTGRHFLSSVPTKTWANLLFTRGGDKNRSTFFSELRILATSEGNSRKIMGDPG
jgi:hypothetical protein